MLQSAKRILALPLLCIVIVVAACRTETTEQPAISEVMILPAESVPGDPGDSAWQSAPQYVAALILQDLVDPRQMTPSTGEVAVQAISDGDRVAFRLEWADQTLDDVPGPARFSDACAIQLPAEIGPTLPAPQMGESSQPVEIAFWSASFPGSAVWD